jgi:hypothetical protein
VLLSQSCEQRDGEVGKHQHKILEKFAFFERSDPILSR